MASYNGTMSIYSVTMQTVIEYRTAFNYVHKPSRLRIATSTDDISPSTSSTPSPASTPSNSDSDTTTNTTSTTTLVDATTPPLRHSTEVGQMILDKTFNEPDAAWREPGRKTKNYRRGVLISQVKAASTPRRLMGEVAIFIRWQRDCRGIEDMDIDWEWDEPTNENANENADEDVDVDMNEEGEEVLEEIEESVDQAMETEVTDRRRRDATPDIDAEGADLFEEDPASASASESAPQNEPNPADFIEEEYYNEDDNNEHAPPVLGTYTFSTMDLDLDLETFTNVDLDMDMDMDTDTDDPLPTKPASQHTQPEPEPEITCVDPRLLYQGPGSAAAQWLVQALNTCTSKTRRQRTRAATKPAQALTRVKHSLTTTTITTTTTTDPTTASTKPRKIARATTSSTGVSGRGARPSHRPAGSRICKRARNHRSRDGRVHKNGEHGNPIVRINSRFLSGLNVPSSTSNTIGIGNAIRISTSNLLKPRNPRNSRGHGRSVALIQLKQKTERRTHDPRRSRGRNTPRCAAGHVARGPGREY